MNYSEEEGGGKMLTFENTINDVLMYGLPTKEAVYSIINNLDVLPANISFEMFDGWVKNSFLNLQINLIISEKIESSIRKI